MEGPARSRLAQRHLRRYGVMENNMTNWTRDELDQIGSADELAIVTLRQDGSARKPVTIWIVREGDGLYIRSGHGREAAWYRGALARQDGRISAGGVEKDVTFLDAEPDRNDEIDGAYRNKYRRYGTHYVTMVTSAVARSTTIRIEPYPLEP